MEYSDYPVPNCIYQILRFIRKIVLNWNNDSSTIPHITTKPSCFNELFSFKEYSQSLYRHYPKIIMANLRETNNDHPYSIVFYFRRGF